ncbi:lytic transglycosylase domain-containing protein [Erythrobacter sp. YT30]|uniref:lytic transglycosylase domain-containing protein n=1 Tax=Erythrobacter sp. YT30 TaxID=1735012 RepID=UPI001F233535|nr:lytic transglycosylase domain-containing protein [Erythrobacter sp. YT30]
MSSVMRGLGIAAGITASFSFSSIATAQSSSMVAHYQQPQASAEVTSNFSALSAEQRAFYRDVFASIDAQEWQRVEELLNNQQPSILHQVAWAEYFTHAKSPKVSADQIANWFSSGVELPQAAQLGRMGAKRGLTSLPYLPQARSFASQPYISKRTRPRPVNDGTISASTKTAIRDRIKNDDPAGAHALLMEADPFLSSKARAEWRQRVAWSYYIENDDQNALLLADTVADGSGPWVAEGYWTAGLASWRLGDCGIASEAFSRAAAMSSNVELTAAAHYWAHRALIRCREPGRAQEHLSSAGSYQETLYGMLAADQLGIEQAAAGEPAPLTQDEWRALANRSNVKVAVALVEIGRPALADEVLRHEARIGSQQDYGSLAKLARQLGMPSTQLFMAYNAPYGTRSDAALRFPVARWKPATGWRVDPALAFAHALQESNFRASAVSPANARGLMQIMPGTARDHNRRLNLGASYADLNDPSVNLAYGQQHLEMLRDSGATQGLLPKIMAAYNAGLTPVSRWNYEIRDQGDPLLWMESIPYWETRGYVAIVMRNYWMYERAAGLDSPSRRALAEGRWPVFPQMATNRAAMLAQ